mmetsp:Transcript_107799/g.311466  ORF Transcript_107799/g.311466 Transcript_107799/m.311466 type:complete len:512 (-) Transcript_107799:69-1604(-)
MEDLQFNACGARGVPPRREDGGHLGEQPRLHRSGVRLRDRREVPIHFRDICRRDLPCTHWVRYACPTCWDASRRHKAVDISDLRGGRGNSVHDAGEEVTQLLQLRVLHRLGVLLARKLPAAHIGDVRRVGSEDRRRDVRVLLHKGRRLAVQAQEVVADQDLARHLPASTDANHWHLRDGDLYSSRHLSRYALQNEKHGASGCKLLRVVNKLPGGSGGGALHPQAALQRSALWLQTDVAHDGDAGAGHRPDQSGNLPTAFELDHLGPCHAQGRGVLEALGLQQEGAEGHVADEHGLRLHALDARHRRGIDATAGRHRSAHHVLHGDADGVRKAQAAIADGVAHEHEVDARAAREARRGEVVGRDHRELLLPPEPLHEPGEAQRPTGRGPSIPGAVEALLRDSGGGCSTGLASAAAGAQRARGLRLHGPAGDAVVHRGAERAPRPVQQELRPALRPWIKVSVQVAEGRLHGQGWEIRALRRLEIRSAGNTANCSDERHLPHYADTTSASSVTC